MALSSRFSQKLADEITYRFDLRVENAQADGETAPVLDDVTIADIFNELEGTDFWPDFKLEILDWQLAKGIYRVVSKAEYDSAVVLGSKARAYPLHRGSRIDFVGHLQREK